MEAAFKEPMITKVHTMWADATKDEDGQIERLACWEYILADEELASMQGNGDAAKGRAILLAMKEVRALDQECADGRISEGEFKRLYDKDVLDAANTKGKLVIKVHTMWADAKKEEDGQMERLACWDCILADDELAGLVGENDVAKGKDILLAMKEARALDQECADGRISEDEFKRLYDKDVLDAATAKATLISKVHTMWAN